jgi:lysophospholipid acyltransferase (LPLAT)-like uncharacterized protein
MPREDTQFKPGHKRSKGRPRGSKNKISKRALNAIYKSLEDAEDDIEILKDMDKATYWRIVAGLIPKDIDLQAQISGDKHRPININFVSGKDVDSSGETEEK